VEGCVSFGEVESFAAGCVAWGSLNVSEDHAVGVDDGDGLIIEEYVYWLACSASGDVDDAAADGDNAG